MRPHHLGLGSAVTGNSLRVSHTRQEFISPSRRHLQQAVRGWTAAQWRQNPGSDSLMAPPSLTSVSKVTSKFQTVLGLQPAELRPSSSKGRAVRLSEVLLGSPHPTPAAFQGLGSRLRPPLPSRLGTLFLPVAAVCSGRQLRALVTRKQGERTRNKARPLPGPSRPGPGSRPLPSQTALPRHVRPSQLLWVPQRPKLFPTLCSPPSAPRARTPPPAPCSSSCRSWLWGHVPAEDSRPRHLMPFPSGFPDSSCFFFIA